MELLSDRGDYDTDGALTGPVLSWPQIIDHGLYSGRNPYDCPVYSMVSSTLRDDDNDK